MKLRRSLYARPEIVRGQQCTLGAASAWPWEGRGVTRVLESVGRYSGGITVGEAAIYFGQTSRSMVAVSSGGEDGMPARPSRLCHTPERKTGLDARNHSMSGAEPAIGRNCPSGLSWSVPPCLTPTGPGSSRIRARRWTSLGRSGIWGRAATSSRAGGWWLFASMVADGGRRPRHGCGRVLSPSGRVSRWRWRMRSAAISPELFPRSVRRHGAAIRYHQRRCRLTSVRCVGSFTSI
jgi:hypothetical protein